MNNSNKINQKNKSGDNVSGNKNVTINNNLSSEFDIGWLKYIIENEGNTLIKVIEYLKENSENIAIQDDISIPIKKKNKKNELENFYTKYIEKHESKLDLLNKFIQDNDFSNSIDNISNNIKGEIVRHIKQGIEGSAESINMTLSQEKLTEKVFGEIINSHTRTLKTNDQKDLCKLLLYYLYRYCFIGKK